MVMMVMIILRMVAVRVVRTMLRIMIMLMRMMMGIMMMVVDMMTRMLALTGRCGNMYLEVVTSCLRTLTGLASQKDDIIVQAMT